MAATPQDVEKAIAILPTPTTHRAIILKDALEEAKQQRALLKAYVEEQMVPKVDFGVIPGTKKPTLLKPGAEKLLELFRCTPKFHLVEKQEDWERGFFNYMFRARVTSRDSGAVLAEGFGSANSREGRYRWRVAKQKCPKCQKETINRSDRPGEGFYCWRKKGGCGAKFAADDRAITGQALGLVENDDTATLANTILKMAKKRALVDAAIALARCSDMFTQDVEDLEDPRVAEENPPSKDAAQEDENPFPPEPPGPPQQSEPIRAAPASSPAPSTSETAPKRGPADQALRARAVRLWTKLSAAGMKSDEFKPWVEVVLGVAKESTAWTKEDLEALERAAADGLSSDAASLSS